MGIRKMVRFDHFSFSFVLIKGDVLVPVFAYIKYFELKNKCVLINIYPLSLFLSGPVSNLMGIRDIVFIWFD